MDPNPFATNAEAFSQHLHMYDGFITIDGANHTALRLWVDMNTNAIHVNINSSMSMSMTASLETWRTQGYQLKAPQQRRSIYSDRVQEVTAYRTNFLGS